jgi:hypothetical protein
MKSTIKFLLFTVIVLVFTSNTFSQVPNYVPTNGLVGYWPFNGNANDESGNSNNGTVNGATLTSDRFGNASSAYEFFGSNWIECAYNPILNVGTGSFTISCWATKVGGNTFQHFVTRNEITSYPNAPASYALRYQGSGVGMYSSGNPSSSNGSIATSTLLNLSNWNYFVGVYNSVNATISIYVNGVLSISAPIASNPQSYNNNGGLFFGVEHPTVSLPSGPNFLTGKLDDIGIWNRALTPQEITNLYTSTIPVSCLPAYVPTSGLVGYWPFCGNANDESGNGNNGTVNGATLTTDRFGSANSAYSFDGVNDYIDLGNNSNFNINTPKTFSFWTKDLNHLDFQSAYLSKNTGYGAQNKFIIGRDANSGNFFLHTQTTLNNGNWYNSNLPSSNNWYHVIVCVDANTLSFYSNGLLVYSTNIINPTQPSNAPLLIGISEPTFTFHGLMDDLAIYNRALTPAEITQLYTGTSVTPPVACSSFLGEDQTVCAGTSMTLSASSTSSSTACPTLPSNLQTGLVGYWPFCGNANDASGNGNNGTANGATLTTDRFGNANCAYAFNSSGSSISINHSASLAIDNEITLSAWVKPSEILSNSATILTKGSQGAFWNYGLNLGAGVASSYPNFLYTNYSIGSFTEVPLNSWSQITVAISESQNTFKMYLNGIELVQISNLNSNNLMSDFTQIINGCCSSPLTFGRNGVNDGAQFVGSIDDVVTYNRALSAAEILQLYTLGQSTYSWSNGATTASISVTPSTTTTYTCTVTDANGNICTDSVAVFVPQIEATDLTICAGESTTLSVSGINSAATPACAALPTNLQTGLVGYWPFCGNANDASGNGNNGTVNGATLTTDRFGSANSAYSFDGNDNIFSPRANLSSFSVSAWINPSTSDCFIPVVDAYPNSWEIINVCGDGDLSFIVFQPQGQTLYSTNVTLNPNTWYHIGVIYDAPNVKIYVNGLLVLNQNTIPIPNVDGLMNFGASISGNSQYLNGKLDDIAIHNRALTASEIQQLYTLGQTTYSWSTGATTPSITVSPTTTTTYTCTTTINGVSCTDSVTVVVNNPTIDLGNDVTACGTSTTLTAPTGFDSYLWSNGAITNTTTVTANGTYTCTVKQGLCSATDTIDVVLVPLTTNTTPISACDSYLWNGTTYTTSGVYTGTTTNCVTESLNLTITPSSTNTTPISACDSYLWNGTIYTTSGVYTGATTNCVTESLNLTITQSSTNTTPISACDSYTWNGTTYSASGVYTGTTTNCVTQSLNLTITPSSTNTTTITACDSYVWNGTTYTTSGTYTGTTTNCVTESLNLTITPSSTNTTPISACDSYLWNGTTYTTSGVYSGTTTNCVTESLNLTITPSSTNTTTITACDSYVWNGTTYSATGVYTGTTTNCVTESLSLTITASSTNTTTASACNSYTWNGTSYTTSGVYTGTTTNCVTESLNLTITPSSTNTTTITACDSYVWNGTTYTTSGVYTGTTTNCVTESLNLTITPLTTTGSVTTSICAGDSYVWPANGQAYTTTQSGLTVITGCNTATLNLTITPSSTNTTTITACNSYVWNGTTYTTSGVYSGTTTNCVTESLNLTITPSSTNTTIITACGTYTWANNGQTYTTSGVYTGTTTDCVTESLVLTITTGGTSNITTITACGTYTWANNGQTYTTSGVYTGTTTNCVTEFLNLTITPSSTNTLSITACGSYVWNGTTYASSGVYTGTTTNCITQSLNLTIIPPDTNTVNVNATPTYFWVFTGQIYTVSGTYQFLDVNKCVLEILNLSLTNDIAEESSNAFTIFPNPVSDMLYVNLNGQDKQNYLIIDNFGSVVKKGVLGNLINEISVSELSAGLYYFKIEGTKPRKFSKID